MDQKPISFRLFRLSDFPAALALWRASEGVGITESDTPKSIGLFLKRNRGFSLVAHSEGRLVGTILCGHDGRRGCLYHLAVTPEFQRRGIGRTLAQRCLEKLAKAGVLKCNIFVYRMNKSGHQFWKNLRWQRRDDVVLVQRATLS